MSTIRHMGVTKRFLNHIICERDDWRDYFPGFEGERQDCIAALLADPREVFVSCDCPKKADGSCAGKPA